MSESIVYYPLTHPQLGIWYTEKLYPGTSISNIAATIKLNGNIDYDLLDMAINLFIKSNEGMRLRIIEQEGEPKQYITEYKYKKIDFFDFSKEGIESLYAWDTEQTQIPFQFINSELFYFAVFKLDNSNGGLYIKLHHISSDAWSFVLLGNRIIEYYDKLKNGIDIVLGIQPSYIDFLKNEIEYMNSKRFIKDKAYWNDKFSSIPEVITLKKTRVNKLDTKAKRKTFIIPQKLNSKIQDFCQKEKTSPFTLFLAALCIYLNRVTGKDEIVIGTPVLNRSNKQEKETVGMFISTVPLSVKIQEDINLFVFLSDLEREWFGNLRHQKYPYDLLLKDLRIANKNVDDLFDVALSYQNARFDKDDVDFNHVGRWHFNGYQKQSLYIHINDRENAGSLILNYDYLENVFYAKEIDFLHEHIIRLLWHALDNPFKRIINLDMISEKEKKKILYEFNDTNAKYPTNTCIHEIFEEQVKKTPKNIAVVFENQKVSYKELNIKANTLANILRNRGLKPNNIVGIVMDRSIDMIIGALGVLKAGGAYLPIDPSYPKNRIMSILNDSNPSFILTTESLNEDISFTALQETDSNPVIPYVTELRPQIKDFNSLSIPDRSLIDQEKYFGFIGQAMSKNTISIQGTRGCPYHCAYCHKIWPKTHVVRSAANIFGEIMLYYKMGVKRFAFIDDIFNLDKNNSSDLFKLIIDNGIKIQLFFPNGVRGDIISHEYIDLMVQAGTVNIAFALETASPRLQKLINKNLNLDKLRDNLEYLATKYPCVILELFTMHGFPTETEEEALLTLDFIRSIKWIDFPYIHILKIYPGTEMERIALDNGLSEEIIEKSAGMAYHELPDTLPFPKSFTRKYQSEFLSSYFLSKERLIKLLPLQMQVLTEDELVQKYDSFLPFEIHSFNDLLDYVKISRHELGYQDFVDEEYFKVKDFNKKLESVNIRKKSSANALKILFLDLSQLFTNDEKQLNNLVEPPLGHLYLLTHLNKVFSEKIQGKIVKSRVDFNNYTELKIIIDDFKPDLIGIRTLTYCRDFFHKTIAIMRQWGINAPIIAGGPYATSSYNTLLKDTKVNIVVIGEGEATLEEIVGKTIANNNILPEEDVLKKIPGIAFISGEGKKVKTQLGRDVIITDMLPSNDNLKNISNVNKPNDLAYIIYTSGSSGEPKGVMIEHKNIVRLLFNDKFQFRFDKNDVWTMFHSFCFDFSVWEMYGALLNGAKLIIVSKEVSRDTRKFLDVLTTEKVTVLNQTPSAFCNLINEETKYKNRILKLKYVIFGGEALKPAMLKSFKEKYPDTHLINMYGITETTVHVTYKEINEEDISRNISIIGKAIPTLKTYVVDKNLNLLPIGIPGELCVSGDGVGRGYLNKEVLTRQRFVANPFLDSEIMYRSGDLVRLFPKGDIEYLGRIDNQVKIRGFRIELGEIEALLIKFENIMESKVIARENQSGNQQLYAYYVAENEIHIDEIRTFLTKYLPDYMIPAYFIRVDSMPLNSNGKIDAKNLPDPFEKVSASEAYVSPQNELQERLFKIWSKVLESDKIGIDDNFFNLGGDSLSAIKMISQIGNNTAFTDLYANPTIRLLSENISSRNSSDSRYLIKLTNNERHIKFNLICFPYGGGSAISYMNLGKSISKISDEYALYSVNLPGHNPGRNEEFVSINEAANNIVNEIRTNISGNIILYGHCVGSALAVEVARLMEYEKSNICGIFIGGIFPPQFANIYGKSFDPWKMFSDRNVMRFLNIAGLPEAELDSENVEFIMNSFRNDVKGYYEYFYNYKNNKINRLNTTIYNVVGQNDLVTKGYKARYKKWIQYSSIVKLYVIKGANHYFIKNNSDELANIIINKIGQATLD